MCGIAGFCDFGRDFAREPGFWRQALIAMRESIAHRGADQTGEYLRRHIGLAHTRLSIRDIALGRQPMLRTAEGHEYAIVYNGEIYNAEELRAELAAEGYAFDTSCDTEVILNAYIRWGARAVEKLNGIFAFAVWDGARGQLSLYRDRAGVKPLFYTLTPGGMLVFGSELKALFCCPGVTPAIDKDSLREVLGIGPARTPGCGVFCGVQELRPGCEAVFAASGFRQRPYWMLESRPHSESYEETVEQVRFLVADAVRRQMVSDVPVCSFLSGGIDSSIVTALAYQAQEEHGAALNTFSFDFTDNDKNFRSNSFQPEQDAPYVDIMLRQYPTRHTRLFCDTPTLADELNAAADAKDLPGMADVDASLLYFCRLVKQQNKVALTGECADEIFGGYPWFYRRELVLCGTFPWGRDTTLRKALLKDEVVKELDLDGYIAARYAESLCRVPKLEGESAFEARRREIAWLNLKWFMPTLLDRMDRTSMACGLEARVPFADHRILEYVWNVPFSMKRRGGVEKALLRDACGGMLPPQLAARKKSPYPKTYDPRYTAILYRRLGETLADSASPLRPLVDEKKAAAFLEKPAAYDTPWFGQLMAAPQLAAYYLQMDHWMRRFALSV